MLTAEAKKKPKFKYVFRDDSLFDSEILKAGAQSVQLRFFTNVLGQMDASGLIRHKDYPHTNLLMSSTIPNPLQFKPRQLHIAITNASVRDANHLAAHGVLEFNYRGRPKFRAPLSRFFAVTNGALRRTSEIVITPTNWLQRLLFPSVVVERHEIMDDAVLRYTPQPFGGIPLIEALEAFDARINLCAGLTPERDILVRLICSGQMGEPETVTPPDFAYQSPAYESNDE